MSYINREGELVLTEPKPVDTNKMSKEQFLERVKMDFGPWAANRERSLEVWLYSLEEWIAIQLNRVLPK